MRERDWTHGEVEPGDAFMLADGRIVVVLSKSVTDGTRWGRPMTLSQVTWLDGEKLGVDRAMLDDESPDPIFCWGLKL